MQDNLEHVVQAVALAKRSFRIATESIIVGIGLSFVLMALFATGKFPALAGVAAQAILTALVVLNALRARIPGRVLPK